MTLARGDLPYLDQLPQMATLQGFGVLPVLPLFLLAGGGAVGATITAWLGNDEWSTGEYAHYMRTMEDTIERWDKLGWQSGCWEANPAKRQEWLHFWSRFSKHYKRGLPSVYVSDSDEKPARSLMVELANWGAWLKDTCKGDIGVGGAPSSQLPTTHEPGGGGVSSAIKWGAIAVGLVAVAWGLSTARGFVSDVRG